jgi:adenylate kinase
VYVVLLGAPGAGKGTQAPILAGAIGGVHLSTGDMLRQAAREGTPLGQQAREYMVRGELVPDDLVLGMIMERLGLPDAHADFVLDGFPRNVAQAAALDRALAADGKRLDRAVNVEVPREVLVQRLGGRWTCGECQAIYHELNNPPRVSGVCDRCGGELRQRADDRPEAVERRLQVYAEETAPVIDYYRARGVLRRVDGYRPLADVTAALLGALRDEQAEAQV